MNEKQEQNLMDIMEEVHRLLPEKYEKGVREHNSILSEDYTKEQLLDMAIDEAIDQLTYLITLKYKEV